MNKPIDHEIRDEVLDPRSSFVVQAPAGSGKTTTLAKRIIHLLTVVDDPKEIIAISFTKKAAGEMHKKFLDEFAASENQEVVKKIKTRAKKLKWNENFLNLLEIMTIDSLASKITRQAPIFSGSLYKNITEDPYEIYESAVKETMQDNAQLTELFPFLNYDYQKIKNQLIAQLETRDQWIEQIQYYKNNPTKIENETKLYYLNEMKTWVIKLNGLFKKEQIEDIKSILSYQDSKFLKEEN
jgi:superfamily I DNA/RNA helicase